MFNGRSTERRIEREKSRPIGSPDTPSLREVFAVWLLFGISTLLLFVTYTRIAPEKLYNVSRSGLAGGASRVLVQLDFPLAIAAVAIAGILAARVQQTSDRRAGRWLTALLIAAVVLCLVIAKPGVVDQNNLDARWINVVPAVGVLTILAISLVLARRFGLGLAVSFSSADRRRMAIVGLLAIVALPWLFAEAGFYIGRIPGLRWVFMSRQVLAGESEVAVHLGHHHGADGFYLATTALILSRALAGIAGKGLRIALGLYLSVMLAYGLGNMANDAWTEQIWKRGWTTRTAPSVLQPALSPAWGILLIAALAIYLLAFRRNGPRIGQGIAGSD